jgi:hypothetical protein
MILGRARGDANGVLVALRASVATAGKAGRVAGMEALRNAFLGTARQSQLAQQEITPRGMDVIERPATLKASAHLRADARTQQQIKRFVGKKLGRERQRAIGTSHAIEDHASHSFAQCALCLLIRHETSLKHGYQV